MRRLTVDTSRPSRALAALSDPPRAIARKSLTCSQSSCPVREMAEMTYQWKQPYVVDDRKFRATFGFGATAWEPAIDETIAWARATYGVPAARAA